MRRYWQKRPLLMRAALPPECAPLAPSALFALAAQDGVESRLVRGSGDRWSLAHGPFDRLPLAARTPWSLLVQGVNLHHDAADALLRRFHFISAARLDDLMISYANDGGGVGPHFDSYDVFLLQVHGKRRWRIGAGGSDALVPGLPLRILADFRPEQEWLLEPGDMLYLPPHYAHEGTAIGPCMTASIGFRAPALAETAGAFLHDVADRLDLPGRYADPGRATTRKPARVDDHLIDSLAQSLAKVRWTRADLAEFLTRHLSEPKPQIVFDGPARPLAPARFAQAAALRGLRLAHKSTMLYRDGHCAINGEPAQDGLQGNAQAGGSARSSVASARRAALRTLADTRRLTPARCGAVLADATLLATLHDWYAAGWIELLPPSANTPSA